MSRFVSEDPIGFAGGDSNVYSYVRGSPQNFTDRTGLLAQVLGGCVVGAILFGGGAWLLSGRKASAGDVLTAAGGGCLVGAAATLGLLWLLQPSVSASAAGLAAAAGAAVATRAEQVIQVIGKVRDTAIYIGQSGYDVLNVPSWKYSLELNRQWIQEGIDAGRSFLLASPATSQNLVNAEHELTIFGQEYLYLLQAGYRVSGNFMVPGR
jgi:hypothetical protein